MPTPKNTKPRTTRRHASDAPPASTDTSSELLAATMDPDCEPADLHHELAAAREETALLRARLEGRIQELEAALAEAGKARCPVCGERLLRPADESESI